MALSQFSRFYNFFAAAVTAFRNNVEESRSSPGAKAVAMAFKKATYGMSSEEQTQLVQFMLRSLQLPEEYEQARNWCLIREGGLDRNAVESITTLAGSQHVLDRAEFLKRAGFSQNTLSEKIRQHRIFKVPKLVNYIFSGEYYPAFFVDARYDTTLIEKVSMALSSCTGPRKYRFFTTPNTLLNNKTPLEALAEKRLDTVIIAARVFQKDSFAALESNANSPSRNTRRILNRIAILISKPKAAHLQGVSDSEIRDLLKDCENSFYADIEVANSVISRIANELEQLESRLVAKSQIGPKKFNEPWRRVPYSSLDPL
jgi:hypothetical protein